MAKYDPKTVTPMSKTRKGNTSSTSTDSERCHSQVIYGDSYHKKTIPVFNDNESARLCFRGKTGSGESVLIPFSDQALSKHLMLIGSIGTGKTTTINQYLTEVRKQIKTDDVVIVFDTKGDYLKFYQHGDVIIGNDDLYLEQKGIKNNYWNIFAEIESGKRMLESIREISNALFKEACERTNQPFFPNAAKDILCAVMWHFMKTRKPTERTNRSLTEYLCSNSNLVNDLIKMLDSYDEFRSMKSYISNSTSAQTQGVIAELQQVINQYFQGNFNKHGTLSLRRLTEQKGGRFIFIEYDMSIGSVLSPIYSLMFDMAIKQALSRTKANGNVFFVTDEFRLLPNLVHIDDAVNFGRSLGVKFLISIQNVNQIFENYGEHRARSIMSGFMTTITFNVSDVHTRDYIKSCFGNNRKKDSFETIISTKGINEETREGFVVEDWDISRLDLGEAIIKMPGHEPFFFKFDMTE